MAIPPLTGKSNNVTLPSKSTSNEKAGISDTKIKEKAEDSIAITKLAKEITNAFKSSEASSLVNKERVEEIKLALENGTFSINAERTAEKMLQIEEQFNNSR